MNGYQPLMEKKDLFPIKGFREGLLITLGEGDWHKVLDMLLKQIDGQREFFEGAKVAIDVGERKLRAVEVCRLRDQLADRTVTLFALLSKSPSTEAVAETLGLSTQKSILKVNEDELPSALYDGEMALMIQKTLRSGTSVKYTGDVVVVGDVNPGAEILAEGSIYVWGKIKGTAHAGIGGSKNEIITAFEIESENLRIADIDYQDPKLKIKIKRKAEKAIVDGNTLRIVDWEQHKLLE